MQMSSHSQKEPFVFAKSIVAGERVERSLDRIFEKTHTLRSVPLHREKRERIDREFVSKTTGQTVLVEYKADFRASETRNLFFEMYCCDKPSWALTTHADFVIYAVPGPPGIAFVFKGSEIRKNVEAWACNYGTKIVVTHGFFEEYEAEGVAVPIQDLAPFIPKRIFLPSDVSTN